jgi:allophanate hydrolase subunit 2
VPGRSHTLAAGSTIAFDGSRTTAGARAYLALPGGIDVPAVLGSGSTLLSAGFGGLEGRALRPRDVLRPRERAEPRAGDGATTPRDLAWLPLDGDPVATLPASGPWPLRFVAGPGPGADALLDAEWRVRPDSDRIGLRLEGGAVDALAVGSGELLSHGVVRGAIQLPRGGGPLVLLADYQTTGGYPVAGVVVRADHPRLGQLRPGAEIRLEAVTADEARAALVDQARLLARGAAALGGNDAWDELWRSAGR